MKKSQKKSVNIDQTRLLADEDEPIDNANDSSNHLIISDSNNNNSHSNIDQTGDPQKTDKIDKKYSNYSQTQTQSQWTTKHTMCILILRLLIEFIYKNPFLFYNDYAESLHISDNQFGYILVFSEIGSLGAILINATDYMKSKSKYVDFMLIFFSVIGGISSILFTVPEFTNFNHTATVFYCGLCRFITGIAFSFLSATTLSFTAKYVESYDTEAYVRVVSILHYSWPMSTVLNVVAGYLIEYFSWIYVFFLFGVLLIVTSIYITLFILNNLKAPRSMSKSEIELQNTNSSSNDVAGDASATSDNVTDVEVVDDEEDLKHYSIQDVLTNWRSMLILFVSFWLTFRSSSIYVVISSLWMEDVFNLSSSLVGWTNVAIIIGESLAPFFGTHYLSKISLKKAAIISLSLQLVTTLGLMFILSLIFGNDCGNIAIVLIIVILLTFTHQSYYILQQSNAIQFSENKQYSFLLLLGERMSQAPGNIAGLLLTPILWNDELENAVTVFSVFWSICTVFMFAIVFIYGKRK